MGWVRLHTNQTQRFQAGNRLMHRLSGHLDAPRQR